MSLKDFSLGGRGLWYQVYTLQSSDCPSVEDCLEGSAAGSKKAKQRLLAWSRSLAPGNVLHNFT